MPAHRVPLSERLWARIARGAPDACWEWTGQRNGNGYGIVTILHSTRLRAHRVAWELANNRSAEGYEVCHSCDNPPCCNPAHLFLGTHQDNVADMVKKGRQQRGERNGSAILTSAQVDEIRAELAAGTICRVLAARYGVTKWAIHSIKQGRNWARKDAA